MSFQPLKTARQWWHRHLGMKPLPEAIPEISAWFDTGLGSALLADERESLDQVLNCLFGYHLLQLSICPKLDLGEPSRISHRFALHPQRAENPRLSALADYHQLPLPSESIDVVLLHHTLDFSHDPHQLLREATRLVISRGYVVIVAFNPRSLFGLVRWFARIFSSKAHWRHQGLRAGRMLDWLALLDFETVALHQGFYRLPAQRPQVLKYLQWMERWGKKLRLPWGGYYVIVARKDRAGVTPLKLSWPSYRPGALPGLSGSKILGRGRGASRTKTKRAVHSETWNSAETLNSDSGMTE